MRAILRQLEKFFPLLKNTALPALIFMIALLAFYGFQPMPVHTLHLLHGSFFVLAFLSVLVMLYFNRSRPVFTLLVMTLAYIIINLLKRRLGDDFITSPEYQNLTVLLPLNLLLFYFLPDGRLLCRRSIYKLLLIFVQFALVEHLSRSHITFVSLFGLPSAGLNALAAVFFAAALVAFFIRCSLTGFILDTALFFSGFECLLGIYYTAAPAAPIIFFSAAALTLTLAVCLHLYHITYTDPLTGLPERNSFILHSKNFPLKYALGIILVDDYQRLSKVFGRTGINTIIRMITGRITETETDASVYRCDEDEFVVLFRGEDKNSAFTRVEQIRRAVASAEFALRGYKKPLKLTVSCAVSEKKRSDANAAEVLIRANKALQKTYRFTQNITTKA